ncbi:succinate dehydrogenase iron-sulphur protein subunit [Synechocystis sp. PCC 6803]|uniref:Fumarate reductase iron-sulfur subunit n=1 Tax=Synechocystis sp. (strain ATCC 27184 / PCC 6803 / Kazusa) TaxID=1111708 RepID=P73723_SYNY3|nr:MULTISPECIES: succinate dehydrogenase/fumarate reductase iron-sulfur subunit [unclassified Synechocystis]BAM51523.1 succinate dehydrogenase iron-sulfur subunit [Synechocystis sp. PCC 6803] [Bacillus subtilis BEST7613]AGF51459.1 succinate dehydrogenase iron-sulfur protein subunit [Synechocystis sp. PCC 6803]ALJ67462.1 succinate dehydrogenase [Synechocystis sp. PCC 6803]AVP89310.1 succinate dehydrogenase/fumarate reductase iron-sulfur subunit [Synechocystis sp. IPPAS B-1465]MBD2617484.1 succi
MQVQFQILRQKPQQSPYLEKFDLEVEPGATILECLNQIKWEQDGSLNFRKNCRNTICGSCSMRVNGRSALACKENVGSETRLFTQVNEAGIPVVTVAPLGNLPVIKDLIVDMQPFWDDLERVEPYVSTQGRKVPEREFLQTPAEREKLNQMGNCILCGACYSECNAKSVNPDFVGPHALAKAQRLLTDSRDGATADRLESYNNATAGAWGCTRCYLCNEVCPMEVAPMDQIGKIKSALLAQKTAQDSRPVRHRKVMVDLVKAGGWVDERKFGIYVVGNFFRDLKGIASILPLGLRMISSGKFPLGFEPSAGTEEVRSLIEQVQEAEKLANF